MDYWACCKTSVGLNSLNDGPLYQIKRMGGFGKVGMVRDFPNCVDLLS